MERRHVARAGTGGAFRPCAGDAAQLALLFGVALAIRALARPGAFTERGVVPSGLADGFYHLRRIWYSVVRFPDVLSFDPYVNFPEGGHIHWPPGFDWTVAAVARLLVGSGDQSAVESVAAWVPAVLGAFTCVVVATMGSRAFGRLGGAIAGVGLAVLPAHSGRSSVGTIDHHVAVALAAAILIGVAASWLRVPAERRRLGLVTGLGLSMGAPLLLWPGFLIHVLSTQVVLVGAVLAERARDVAVARARGLALAHAVAAVLLLPFGVGPSIEQYGPWSPLVLSRLQPAWLGAAALGLAVCATVWTRTSWGADRGRRLASASVLGLAGVAAVLAGVDGLRAALSYAAGWFTKDEAFQHDVAELHPLDADRASVLLSRAIFLFPIAWLVVAARAARSRAFDLALLLVWAAGFGLLALAQNRFANTFSVPYVLVWAGALAEGRLAAARHLAGARRRAAVAAIGAVSVLLALAALWPVGRYHHAIVLHGQAVQERPIRAFGSMASVPNRVHFGAAWWIGRSTPPTRGFLDPERRPAYGILAGWSVGHLLRYVSERPVVQDNFGPYGSRKSFARARSYFAATDESEAVALLERLRVRYVVADRFGAGVGDLGVYGPRSMTYRLARLFGSARSLVNRRTERRVEVPALRHHRLVYHARSVPGDTLHAPPPQMSVAVYERVAGARVVGRASPGARVEARLRITTGAGRALLFRARRPHVHLARSRADSSGRYALVLPYPTDRDFSDAVRVMGRYELTSEGRSAELAVPESAVRSGGRVRGPDLRVGAPRGGSPSR